LGTSCKLAPAGGRKIMQRVKLTIKQYYFLQGLIKQSIITNVFYKDNHIVIIELSEDDMAEELIDKLYT